LVKGWVGAYDNNEVEIVATDDDPSALRGGKRWKKGQGWNLFKLSGNVVRDDGRHEEYALIRFRLAPNETDGAIEIVVRRGNDEVPALYIDPTGVHCLMNLFAPNISGAGGTFLKNGPWELHLQGDANLVLYDTRTQPWKVLWNTGTQR
jgi:acylphosphatase